jgi:radical SAM family uncharacterized protein/radical SAM-linked protein
MAPLTSTTFANHPYREFVHRVEKPARYVGGEYGATVKDWHGVSARIALAFPDIYDIGMSHLGFKILYRILNDSNETLAERCFCPWIDMQNELREHNLPLVSLESARPLSAFDVVGFSMQFELTYSNILTMLDLGGIALRSSDRDDAAPLVIAGGPTATHPEPLAPFVDAFVIGDGEERAKEIALLWVNLRAQGVPRTERLRALSRLPGVYVPCMYQTQVDDATGFQYVSCPTDDAAPFPVERTLVADINDYPFPDDGPVGGPEAIFDRMSIEIARGCTEGCRFCQAGMIYRPVRERDPESIVNTLVSAVKKSGYDEASITALSTADYSCIAPLVEKVTKRLTEERVSLGISSLRAYGLNGSVLDDLESVRASGLTFAPEAGSQRMRDVVNKNVTEAQLMETAERVFSRNWKAMKLYFMIGLPTEEESDIREIVGVGARACDVGKRVKRERFNSGAPKVTVSVSTHVPKPHTPFQWCAMDDAELVKVKQGWLRDEARKARGVELKVHDATTSWLEGVFARGDRAVALVLERAYQNGARFDSWEDQLKMDVWVEAFAFYNIDPAKYLGTIPVTARLPWDHISVGLEDGFLADEYRKALKNKLSPPCGKVAGHFVQATNLRDAEQETRRLVCYDCGVACDLTAMRTERLVYLRKLDAHEPRPAKVETVHSEEVAAREDASVGDAEVVASAQGSGQGSAPSKRARPMPKVIEQGAARRYRLVYAKTGPSAFLGHLDTIRALPRVFRRMEVPMYYTGGFHPKPDMSFGPALQLGVQSTCEVLDIKLTIDMDPNEIVAGASKRGPDGLTFLRAVRLEKEDLSITKIITGATYALLVAEATMSRARLKEVLAEAESKAEWVMDRELAHGLRKRVNIRPFIRNLTLSDTSTTRTLQEQLGIDGQMHMVQIATNVQDGASARPNEIVTAILGNAAAMVIRTGLGRYVGDELVDTTELLRMRPPLKAAAPEATETATAE